MIGLKSLTLVGLSTSILFISLGCSQVSFQKGGAEQSTQGSGGGPPPPSGGTVVNSYFFVKRTADILFVIDTSGSMAQEQALLQNGFPSFTSTLNTYSGGTLEWHVAITSTDIQSTGTGKQGALVPFSGMGGAYFLDSSMNVNSANASFQSTVVLGVGGTGDERGIAAARMTAQKEFSPATTHGFIRSDTPLSVIVLSDEDERSTSDPSSSEYKPLEAIDEPNNFIPGIRALDTISTIPKTITFHSIVTSTQACLDGAGAYMGLTYMSLSTMTNGIVGDVCALSLSYQDQLQSLAMNIVNEAKTYTLPCNNVQTGTTTMFEQTLGGALIVVPSTFVPPNKVVLQNAPPVGSLIKAHFTCLD